MPKRWTQWVLLYPENKINKNKKKTRRNIIINSNMVINGINRNKYDTVLNRNSKKKENIESISNTYIDRIKKNLGKVKHI